MFDELLSEEDKQLFRESMRDVKPLLTANLHAEKKPTDQKPTPKKREPSPNAELRPYLSDYQTETVSAQTILSYALPALPKKRFLSLQKGLIPIEASLDLHGLYKESAKEALTDFICQQRQKGARCLLIIHGKGSLQQEAPILKNLVNRWLKQFPQVLAFHSALSKHGGSGALYLLLKNNKLETN